MTISFQVEPWAQVWGEASALWDAHYREVGQDQTRMKLDPDLAKCKRLADLGVLHIVVGRDQGRLVSYHASIVDTLLHYRTILAANSDIYYLHPDWRKGRNGMRMFQAVEATCKARGVVALYDATKIALDHSRLFEALGYRLMEKRYSKWIGD